MSKHRPKLPNPIDQPLDVLRSWFETKGWQAWEFQTAAWTAYLAGKSGLIHVSTGAGKTYAAYLGPLAELMAQPLSGISIVYITPLRALSRDTEAALRQPIDELKLNFSIESRTGDTSASARTRQIKSLPNILITTPESLSLLLAREDAAEKFASLRSVIIDEWHELISTKRGSLLELSLARLRQFAPLVRTWALSATLGNTYEAAQCVTAQEMPLVIHGEMDRPIEIRSVIPEDIDSFPWAGHIGLRLVEQVCSQIRLEHSTLLFTNTRRQAEKWFQAVLHLKPEWASVMGLHHGSLEKSERERIEMGVKKGELKLVICTSSLDLGVDFAQVESVWQVGSPKGIGRIIQRAGRAAHRPGATCQISFAPTHALELLEIEAVRRAIASQSVESRTPLSKPLDILTQHMMTCAVGGGFDADELYDEVLSAYSYRHLTRQEFDWVLSLLRNGGDVLSAYPDFCRIKLGESNRYEPSSPRLARLHRMNIGTITSNATLTLKYITGKPLGTIEEAYIAKLQDGDRFVFGGKILQLVKIYDSTAYVKPAKGITQQTPTWQGGRLPFSPSLSYWLRMVLDEASRGDRCSPELKALDQLLNTQAHLSRIPTANSLLAEMTTSREGWHLFLFPFEGRSVHEALAILLALRLSRLKPATFTLSSNDYGLELLANQPFPFDEYLHHHAFSPENLLGDILEAANLSQLSKRHFRVIARVAGLVMQTYPGVRKSGRQVQASSSLIFDVFRRFDPNNLLVEQAQREVLEETFEQSRLLETLERLRKSPIALMEVSRPSPLAFPLMVERVGARISGESLRDRVERMKQQWLRQRQKRLSLPEKSFDFYPSTLSTGRPTAP